MHIHFDCNILNNMKNRVQINNYYNWISKGKPSLPQTIQMIRLPSRELHKRQVEMEDSFVVIAAILEYIHITTIFMYAALLIILEPAIRINFSLTLLIVIVYGFMLVWRIIAYIVSYVAVQVKQIQQYEDFMDNFLVVCRWIIIFFPLPALIALVKQYFLLKRSIISFMAYQLVLTIMMSIYQIYACTQGLNKNYRIKHYIEGSSQSERNEQKQIQQALSKFYPDH